MGFLSKLMGMGGAKSDAQKERIRGLFNERVKDGESYKVVAAFHVVVKDNLLKQTHTYYNYIIGYKNENEPEIVVIPTDCELSSLESPVYCKKSECSNVEYLMNTGSFSFVHPNFGSEPLTFSVIPSTSIYGGYIIKVSYLDEFADFAEFFQNCFAK